MSSGQFVPRKITAEPSTDIQESSAVSGFPWHLDNLSCDRLLITKRIGESPYVDPEYRLQHQPTLRDLFVCEFEVLTRQNWVANGMGSDRHSGRSQLQEFSAGHQPKPPAHCCVL